MRPVSPPKPELEANNESEKMETILSCIYTCFIAFMAL